MPVCGERGVQWWCALSTHHRSRNSFSCVGSSNACGFLHATSAAIFDGDAASVGVAASDSATASACLRHLHDMHGQAGRGGRMCLPNSRPSKKFWRCRRSATYESAQPSTIVGQMLTAMKNRLMPNTSDVSICAKNKDEPIVPLVGGSEVPHSPAQVCPPAALRWHCTYVYNHVRNHDDRSNRGDPQEPHSRQVENRKVPCFRECRGNNFCRNFRLDASSVRQACSTHTQGDIRAARHRKREQTPTSGAEKNAQNSIFFRPIVST